ncbi:MAG TPA: secretin N-terminal domain-containing protein [Gemmatimonadaceae bacterium]
MRNDRRPLLTALLAACLAALPAGPPVAAQDTAAVVSTPQGIVVDFQDAEIRTVITALAEAASLNVIFSDLPSRRITLRLRQPVPPDSVAGLLRTIAEANGLRVVEQGGLIRIEAPAPAAAPARAPAGGEPRLFVYRLRHANAARLAATLQSIFGGAGPVTTPLSRSPLSQRLREQRIPPLVLDTLTARPVQEGRAPTTPGAVAPTAQIQGELQIVPDETTNSLIVRASAEDWAVLQQAIEAVDLRPLQVLIEVLIAEVRHERDVQISVSGRGKGTVDGDRVTGELKGLTDGDLLLDWAHGGSVSLRAALSALATRGDVRILSRPVLLAQNNQEAFILIGSQRPFVQVFRSLPTDAGVRDQIVQYRDVGTSLTILPTVSQDGYVNLQLTQEVSGATNETQFGAPVISTREASTFLFVRDGQTTMIGGLIDRQTERTRRGVPLLIDIPVLGGLFGTTRNTTTRSELFLFLTPHIVRTDDDVDQLRDALERRLELLRRELPGVMRIEPAAPGPGEPPGEPPAAAQPPGAPR